MLGFSISLSIAYMCLNTGEIGRDAKWVPKKCKHTAVGGIHECAHGQAFGITLFGDYLQIHTHVYVRFIVANFFSKLLCFIIIFMIFAQSIVISRFCMFIFDCAGLLHRNKN